MNCGQNVLAHLEGVTTYRTAKVKCKEKRPKLSPKCTHRKQGNSRPGCDSKHLYINTEKLITGSMRVLHAAETQLHYRPQLADAKCSRTG